MKTFRIPLAAICLAAFLLTFVNAVQVIQPQQKLVPSITPFAGGDGYYLNARINNQLGHTETFYLTTEIFDDCDVDSQPLYEFEVVLNAGQSITVTTEFPLEADSCPERLTLHSDVFYRIPNAQNNVPYANKSVDYCIVPACGMQ